MMELTRDNYYSLAADRAYFSCSQFEDFLRCEAAAIAKIEGRYTPKKTEALLVGNFFHTAFEGEEAHAAFIEEYADEIMTKSTKSKPGHLKAPYQKASEMIAVMKSDPAIQRFLEMPGETEMPMTGKLFGHYPWKICLDRYIPGPPRMIIDWKTVASIRKLEWSDEEKAKVSFVRNFRYLFRAAVYMEIERQFTGSKGDPAFILACVSKEDPPDKELIHLNNRQALDLELEKVKEKIWHFNEIKEGRRKPTRCGRCAYCRATKQLKEIIPYTALDPGDMPEMEEDYAAD